MGGERGGGIWEEGEIILRRSRCFTGGVDALQAESMFYRGCRCFTGGVVGLRGVTDEVAGELIAPAYNIFLLKYFKNQILLLAGRHRRGGRRGRCPTGGASGSGRRRGS